MTIIHIDTGLTMRGGQRQVLNLARGLLERGHSQTIVSPEGSQLSMRAHEEGLHVFPLPANDLGHAHGICQLRQFLLSSSAHILHAHDGRAQTVSWLASWGLPVRRVASRRVTFLPRTRARHRIIYSWTCHAVIAVSMFIRDLLIQSGVTPGKIKVIPDGIEIPRDAPSEEERSWARREWGLEPGDFIVGYLGAATPEKGLPLAVAGFAMATQRLPQAKLLVMCDVPLQGQQSLLGTAGDVRSCIQFLGARDDVRPFFAAIDLFWMPSVAEGLGSAALLAMAHGCPVVASRAGGLPEVISDGKTGWLVEPGEPLGFAEAAWEAFADRRRLLQMAIAAREKAHLFSTDIMVAHTERLYRQLA